MRAQLPPAGTDRIEVDRQIVEGILRKAKERYLLPTNHDDVLRLVQAVAEDLGHQSRLESALCCLFMRLPRALRVGDSYGAQILAFERHYGVEGMRRLLDGPVTCYD